MELRRLFQDLEDVETRFRYSQAGTDEGSEEGLTMLTRQAQRKLDKGLTCLASRNKRAAAIAPLLRKAGHQGIDTGARHGRKKLGGSF